MTQLQGTLLPKTLSIMTTGDTVTNEHIELVLSGILMVDNLKTNYTYRQIEETERARKSQNTIGPITGGVLREIDLKIM